MSGRVKMLVEKTYSQEVWVDEDSFDPEQEAIDLSDETKWGGR